jgi:hypothetical protein
MSNFENIDEYLTNRLSEQDRKGFEQQLGTDSALKAEVEFQTQVIEGLKKARAAELKAMLSKVPIESGSVTDFPTLKVAAGLIGAAIIVSAGYLYYSNNNKAELPVITTPIEDSVIQSEEAQPNDREGNKDIIELPKEPEATSTQQQAKPLKAVPSSKPSDKEEASQPVDRPALDVIDPSQELTESTPTRGTTNNKPVLTIPKMNVEVDSSSKKYPFHYQFTDGKMILFGSFDKSLYEIIEINGESHSVFLYHKENYYKLDESKNEITPLEPVKDKVLIQKLKEYRKK